MSTVSKAVFNQREVGKSSPRDLDKYNKILFIKCAKWSLLNETEGLSTLTLVLVRLVWAGSDAVICWKTLLGDGVVCVDGERENAGVRDHTTWRSGTTVSTNMRPHWERERERWRLKQFNSQLNQKLCLSSCSTILITIRPIMIVCVYVYVCVFGCSVLFCSLWMFSKKPFLRLQRPHCASSKTEEQTGVTLFWTKSSSAKIKLVWSS